MKRVMKPLIEAGHVVTRHPEHFNRTTYWSVAPEFLHVSKSYDAADGIAGSDGTESYDVLHDNNIRTIRGRFTPPTKEEVNFYCEEKGLFYVDAEDFINFYESKDWMIGKNKMSKWKAAVSRWNNGAKKQENTGGNRGRI